MASNRTTRRRRVRGGLLNGSRGYLSGPMDFVASREVEAKTGWRVRIGQLLRDFGVVVFDPWNKPEVRGLHGFGKETADSTRTREGWTFENSRARSRTLAQLTGHYWETLHIDLRIADTADFVIAYCPTNIYSVGTVHEIALGRLERKPVFGGISDLRRAGKSTLPMTLPARAFCRRWESSFRSSRTRAAFPVSGTCRWSAARTSSTALASSFRHIKDATAGRVHPWTSASAGARQRVRYCRSSKS